MELDIKWLKFELDSIASDSYKGFKFFKKPYYGSDEYTAEEYYTQGHNDGMIECARKLLKEFWNE